MGKKQFFQQISIDDDADACQDYEDDHLKEFCRLLFDELLFHIKNIPFDRIIQTNLQFENAKYKTQEANSLFWLYRADRKLIETTTIYSFHFANACHPEFYKTFETKAHRLFLQIPEIRHRYHGWYKYIGQDLLNDIDNYLNIQRVVEKQIPHRTKLFINQKEDRLDIQFNFDSIKERIAICFEPGYPANP